MSNRIIRGLSQNKEVRVFIANTTNMIEKTRSLYDMSPVSIAAVGRLMTASALMSQDLKENQHEISLRIRGKRDVKSLIAVSKANGDTKGYISNPYVIRPVRESDGKLDVGGAIGTDGELFVVKDYKLKDPYVGNTNLITGEIAEDIANYFASSEQQPSVVSLGVYVNTDGEVQSSGGFIIQTLPNVSEETINYLEEDISNMPPISQVLKENLSLEDILEKYFPQLNFEINHERNPKWYCDCSKERMANALKSLGKEDLTHLKTKDKTTEIHCHFCNTNYLFNKEELTEIISELK